MSIINFEGFETVGATTGSGDAANVKARLNLRYTIGSSAVYLRDDFEAVGYSLSLSNYLSTLLHSFPSAQSGKTYICGARYHVPDTATRDLYVFAPKESMAQFFRVIIEGRTDINVKHPPVGASLGSAASVLTPGSWHYIECKFLVASAPNGFVEVYVDGVEVINSTGIDTSYFGTNVLGMTWGGSGTSGSAPSDTGDDFCAMDDLYFLEVDATEPNDYLGPNVRVESLPPNADDTVEWTTSTGSDHYALVDENPADSADNVYTDVDGEEEMFEMTDNADAAYIYAVKVEVEAIDDIDAGANNIDVRIDSGGTISETNHNVTNTGSYAVFTHIEGADDPNTGSSWTRTNLNAAKIGVQYNT